MKDRADLAGDWGTLNSDKTKITFTFVLDAKTASGVYKISDIRLYDLAGNQNFVSNADLIAGEYTNNWTITNAIGDNDTPQILGVTLTPLIDTSDLNRKQIKVAVTVDDQVTDINSIYIRIFSPADASIDEYIVSLGRLGTTTKTGNTYEYVVSLPLEYPDGVYTVSFIAVSDKALNEQTYQVGSLAGLGLDTTVVFTNSNTPLFDNTTQTFSVQERLTTAATVTATDPTADALTYSLSGDDSSLFSISSSGVISFNTVPDFESPSDSGSNNVYQLTVNVTDGTNTNAKTILISVTDGVDNYAPVILNASVCSTAYENVMSVCELEGTDGDGDSLTFTVTGTDAADFVISNSVLKFAVNPDFENPADANTNNEYEITLNASDGSVTTTRDLKLQVLNVEENQLGEGSFGTSVTE